MLQLCRLMLTATFAIQIRGQNIMLNKPSVQSSTYDVTHVSSKGNDGTKWGYPSHTVFERNLHYWQGDLLGFYIIHSISVDSGSYGERLKKASVGVSVHDVNCPEDKLTVCGQWPDQDLNHHHIAFNCSHAVPIRFVRIWRDRNVVHGLAVPEVEVEGVPVSTGAWYKKTLATKITTPTQSLFVTSASDCATMCHMNMPCLAFSYSSSEMPNCLLTTDVMFVANENWISYKTPQCFPKPICK